MTKIILTVLFIGFAGMSVFAQDETRETFNEYQLDSLKYDERNLPPGRFQTLAGQFYPNWEPHLGKGLLQLPKYFQWKQKLSSKGFDYLIIITPEFQYGNLNSKWHGNTEQDLIMQWRITENENSYSKFLFWGANILRLTSTTPTQMSEGNGLTVETIGGADAEVLWMIGTFYFEQALFKQRLKITAGHLFTNLFLATNKYLIDDRETYINELLNSPAGVQWTSQKSLGIRLQYDADLFYGIIGFQDQKSDPRYPSFSSFADGKFVYYLEGGFTPNVMTNHSGKYSVTVNYSTADAQGPEGYGIIINAQQDFSNNLGVFGRFGQSFKRFGTWDNAWAVGLALNKPFGWDYDQISLAYLQGDPSNPSITKKDKGFSLYYKVLLTYRTDFTIDTQYYFERSIADNGDNRQAFLIAGRLRFML